MINHTLRTIDHGLRLLSRQLLVERKTEVVRLHVRDGVQCSRHPITRLLHLVRRRVLHRAPRFCSGVDPVARSQHTHHPLSGAFGLVERPRILRKRRRVRSHVVFTTATGCRRTGLSAPGHEVRSFGPGGKPAVITIHRRILTHRVVLVATSSKRSARVVGRSLVLARYHAPRIWNNGLLRVNRKVGVSKIAPAVQSEGDLSILTDQLGSIKRQFLSQHLVFCFFQAPVNFDNFSPVCFVTKVRQKLSIVAVTQQFARCVLVVGPRSCVAEHRPRTPFFHSEDVLTICTQQRRAVFGESGFYLVSRCVKSCIAFFRQIRTLDLFGNFFTNDVQLALHIVLFDTRNAAFLFGPIFELTSDKLTM